MDSHPLDFEKPILELQRRLQDLKNHSDEHEIDFDTEVESMELKIRETRRAIYDNLTAWQRVQIARHVQRPFALDYVSRCFTDWIELRGDRAFGDDKAMPCGLAKIGSHRCVVITNQKGRDTKENVKRNFGCAHPEGYRKALRLMRLAEKFRLPVISLIDTPGAFPGIGSEERHIAEAIAVNLREMMTLRVPIIAAVVGEGGSGGALGLGVADEIVPEPEGGAHRDHDTAAANLGGALRRNLQRLTEKPFGQLLKKRYEKFRRLGNFAEKTAPTVKP